MRDSGGGGGYPQNLPEVGEGFQIDRDVLRTVRGAMYDDRKTLDDWGTRGNIKDFRQDGRVTPDDLGHYPAVTGDHGVGGGLAQTCQNAYDKISGTYQQFLDAYDGVIEALDSTLGNYQRTEDANATTYRRLYR